MGLAGTLINVTPNEIVYRLANTSGEGDPFGTSFIITANGSSGPLVRDLVDDCVNSTWGRAASGRLRRVCRAGLDGLGTVAPGAWTQALARDLLLGDGTIQAGNLIMPRAELDLTPESGSPPALFPMVTVGVSGDGTPRIEIATAAAGGSAILRVRLRSSPGVR